MSAKSEEKNGIPFFSQSSAFGFPLSPLGGRVDPEARRMRGESMIHGSDRPGYDIGTKFLYFQCFVTTDMFLFCKTILYSGNCRIFRDLAFGNIKTRFKAILKKLKFSAQVDIFKIALNRVLTLPNARSFQIFQNY